MKILDKKIGIDKLGMIEEKTFFSDFKCRQRSSSGDPLEEQG